MKSKNGANPSVHHVWSTPNGDELLGYLARVSNPKAELGDPSERLINYLIKHNHWSPFEMVSSCVEINTTRDIARQILRHRSFSFQEFSQRYAVVESASTPLRECRLQDTTNRQHSLPNDDEELDQWWEEAQQGLNAHAQEVYGEALSRGIAKEQARAVLLEGLTPTKMYMTGNLRSWIHYWNVRVDEATQKEHQQIAQFTKDVVLSHYPGIRAALELQE